MDEDAFGEVPRDSSGMQRVKLYRLTPEGLWEEKGTGSVSVEYMEVCDSLSVVSTPLHRCAPSLTAALRRFTRLVATHISRKLAIGRPAALNSTDSLLLIAPLPFLYQYDTVSGMSPRPLLSIPCSYLLYDVV